MKTNLYAIYDTAAAMYMKPWGALTDPQAQREFGDILEMKDHPIAKHPEHYFLCRIGTWNDATAKIEDTPNETILTGLEGIAQLNQNAQTMGNGSEPVTMEQFRKDNAGHFGEENA